MTKEREELLIKRVKNGSFYLSDIGEEDQTDEIIDLAMERNIWAFVDIKDEKKKTLERCLKMVRRDRFMLRYVPEDMRDKVMNKIKKGE